MVSIAKVPRRSTRFKATTSTSAINPRKAPRSTTAIVSPPDSPPDSPPGAKSQALGAPRGGRTLDFEDPTQSPFYLHSSDHPGSNIISHRLDETNYGDWSVAMRISLDAKNKLGFIDGTLIRPLETDRNFRLWSRCNSMVKSWLLNSVNPQIYRSILRINDAVDIWRDLFSRFHLTNLPRTYNLTQEIQDLRQGSKSLSEYYTLLKTLWDQLEGAEEQDDPCTCGKAIRFQQKVERAKIVKFLAGLNESYAIVRRQIIAKKALPSLAEVYNILDQDNSQKGFSNIVTPPAAFQVSEQSPSSTEFPTVMYVQTGPNKGRPICSFCNRVGHIAERCYRKYGFPPGSTPKGKFADKVPKTTNVTQPLTAQVTAQVTAPVSEKIPVPMNDLIGHLSKEQIQQFIALFSSQLQNQSISNPVEATSSQSPLDHSGSYQGVDDWTR